MSFESPMESACSSSSYTWHSCGYSVVLFVIVQKVRCLMCILSKPKVDVSFLVKFFQVVRLCLTHWGLLYGGEGTRCETHRLGNSFRELVCLLKRSFSFFFFFCFPLQPTALAMST